MKRPGRHVNSSSEKLVETARKDASAHPSTVMDSKWSEWASKVVSNWDRQEKSLGQASLLLDSTMSMWSKVSRSGRGFGSLSCMDFIGWAQLVGQNFGQLELRRVVLWGSRVLPFHHEFITATFVRDSTFRSSSLVPTADDEQAPLDDLVHNGLMLRIDRGRQSQMQGLQLGSHQMALDMVELIRGEEDLENCEMLWEMLNKRVIDEQEVQDRTLSPRLRDFGFMMQYAIAMQGKSYDLFRRNCWGFASQMIQCLYVFFPAAFPDSLGDIENAHLRYGHHIRRDLETQELPERVKKSLVRRQFGGFEPSRTPYLFRVLDPNNIPLCWRLPTSEIPMRFHPLRGFLDQLRLWLQDESFKYSVQVKLYMLALARGESLLPHLAGLDMSNQLLGAAKKMDFREKSWPLDITTWLLQLAVAGDDGALRTINDNNLLPECARTISLPSDDGWLHMLLTACISARRADRRDILGRLTNAGWIPALAMRLNKSPGLGDEIIQVLLYLQDYLQDSAYEEPVAAFADIHVISSFVSFIKNVETAGCVMCVSDDTLEALFTMLRDIMQSSPEPRALAFSINLASSLLALINSRRLSPAHLEPVEAVFLELFIEKDGDKFWVHVRNVHAIRNIGVCEELMAKYPSKVFVWDYLINTPFAALEAVADRVPHRVALEVYSDEIVRYLQQLDEDFIKWEDKNRRDPSISIYDASDAVVARVRETHDDEKRQRNRRLRRA